MTVKVTYRLPEELENRLKAEWRNHFHNHMWSYNRWLVALLDGALEVEPLLDGLKEPSREFE